MDRNKRGACKPCVKLAFANWYKANSEKVKLAGANWRKVNPDYNTNWYKANHEKAKLAAADRYKANPEKRKLTAAKWRKANHEKIKFADASWRKANPYAHRIHKQNRRARKRANGGKLSPDLAKILLKRQKGKCACCKEPLGKGYHLDHIMPIALGGKNEDWNMQLLRTKCNLQKSAKHPIEYMQSKGLLL